MDVECEKFNYQDGEEHEDNAQNYKVMRIFRPGNYVLERDEV